MVKSSKWKIASAFGVPIYLDWSLVALVLYFAFRQGGHFLDAIIGAVISVVLIFASVLLHELGHTVAALAFGCRVRDITLTFIGGRATLLEMPRDSWREFVVAVAGPLVSLALWLVPSYFVWTGIVTEGTLFNLLFFVFLPSVNRMLFLFNLIPAFPMDGGRIFRSILAGFIGKLRASFIAYRVGQVLAGCMAVFALFDHFNFSLMLIAYFIFVSAKAEYEMLLQEAGASFRGKPPDDAAVISPPPYGGHDEVTDIFKER